MPSQLKDKNTKRQSDECIIKNNISHGVLGAALVKRILLTK